MSVIKTSKALRRRSSPSRAYLHERRSHRRLLTHTFWSLLPSMVEGSWL